MATKEQRTQVLSEINKRDGHIRPSKVVEEARAKDSLIHDEFEWNTKKAAYEYNLAQARRLIRVTPIRVDESFAYHRLVHVPPVQIEGPTAVDNGREGVYKPIATVVKSESEYERALRQLQQQMHSIERSINELKRACGKDEVLLPTLVDAMKVARDTIRLMLERSSAA